MRAREQAGGGLPLAVRPRPRVDGFAVKIEEWVDRSRGKIRADVAHQRLVAMGSNARQKHSVIHERLRPKEYAAPRAEVVVCANDTGTTRSQHAMSPDDVSEPAAWLAASEA